MIKKPKLLRSNPIRYSLIKQGADPSLLEFDDEALCTRYRKVKLVEEEVIGDTISEYAENRLLIARVLALKKYREIYKSDEQA